MTKAQPQPALLLPQVNAGQSSIFRVAGLCRVSMLKQRVLCIAAANKHSVAIVEGGTVFSWGANDQGQLGYGTSDSASNAVPRLVEAMKVG